MELCYWEGKAGCVGQKVDAYFGIGIQLLGYFNRIEEKAEGIGSIDRIFSCILNLLIGIPRPFAI